MFPLAFVAGWLQGHWWGFISRNYVVWPTFLLMNVFTALKGSHFRFLFKCMWNLSGFLCKNPECPGAQGQRPLCQSHLGGAVLNCAILAVAPIGIVLVTPFLSSMIESADVWQGLGKHHDRKPQGQSFLKGQYVERDEGDFWALQKGSRKGFNPVLPKALAGAYWPYLAHGESHVF